MMEKFPKGRTALALVVRRFVPMEASILDRIRHSWPAV
jgi:hypothetical protein